MQQQAFQGVERRLRLQGRAAHAALQGVLDVLVAREETGIVDGAPQHGSGRQTLQQAMTGQGFEPMVGRHVVGLPRVAEQGGRRGEQHEEVQRQVRGQFVQVLRALGLGFEHPLQLRLGQVADQSVFEHGGGMHHAS
ncbi:hypothetical protein D3C73_1079930 [compost metagenome]